MKRRYTVGDLIVALITGIGLGIVGTKIGHAQPISVGQQVPDTSYTSHQLQRTKDYLEGRSNDIGPEQLCVIEARAVYRSLDGHDRHYLILWISSGAHQGESHVVVVNDGKRIDPLLNNDYQSVPLQISEPDGWHFTWPTK